MAYWTNRYRENLKLSRPISDTTEKPNILLVMTDQHAARALGAAAVALDIAEADEDAGLRRHLDAAAEALHAMQAEGAGLPESLAEWRQFMLNELDAEIFVYELLMTEYAATDCRIAD